MIKRIEERLSSWLPVRRTGIESPAVAGATPKVWTMILLDVSGSMTGRKLVEAKKAVRAYALDACPFGEWVGLMTFSDAERLIALPGGDASVVCASAEKLQIEGGTNITPALKSTELLGEGVRVIRKVVVVTDGMTMRPEEALVVAARMRSAGFFFVTRGIPEADEKFLEKLRGPEGVGHRTEVGGLVKAMKDAVRLLPSPR